MNLLIVDDEYLVVEEVVTVTDWELLGITEIYSATNAVSAVRILNEKKIDIMICDIEMPQTDGLELSKKAKENFPDLEIVMLTSHAEFNYVRNALRYGCYDYLLKPVMEDDIIKVMKNLVTKIERDRYRDRKRERVKTGTSHPRRLRQIQKCDFDRDGTFRTASRTARQVGVLH